jgi:hypothetical protein
LCSLLYFATDDFRNELSGELCKSAAGGLALDNLNHLSANGSDLRRGGICGLLDLIGAALGEGDGEEAEEVVVGGFDGRVGFDEGLPFADEGAEFVRGEVEAVEVGQAVLALHFVDTELDFSEGVVFILLEIGKGDFEDAAFEGVVGILETSRSVDKGFADTKTTLERLWLKFTDVVVLSDLKG